MATPMLLTDQRSDEDKKLEKLNQLSNAITLIKSHQKHGPKRAMQLQQLEQARATILRTMKLRLV